MDIAMLNQLRGDIATYENLFPSVADSLAVAWLDTFCAQAPKFAESDKVTAESGFLKFTPGTPDDPEEKFTLGEHTLTRCASEFVDEDPQCGVFYYSIEGALLIGEYSLTQMAIAMDTQFEKLLKLRSSQG